MKKRTDPNVAYWRSVMQAAERELEAATGNSTLKAAAKRYMRAKAEVRRLEHLAGGLDDRQRREVLDRPGALSPDNGSRPPRERKAAE